MYFGPPAPDADLTPQLVLKRRADGSVICRLEAGSEMSHPDEHSPRSLRTNITTADHMVVMAARCFLLSDNDEVHLRIREGLLFMLGALYLADVRGQFVSLVHAQIVIRSVCLHPDMNDTSRAAVATAAIAVCKRQYCTPAGKVRRINKFDWCRLGFELVAHIRTLEAADELFECARRAVGFGADMFGVGTYVVDPRR